MLIVHTAHPSKTWLVSTYHIKLLLTSSYQLLLTNIQSSNLRNVETSCFSLSYCHRNLSIITDNSNLLIISVLLLILISTVLTVSVKMWGNQKILASRRWSGCHTKHCNIITTLTSLIYLQTECTCCTTGWPLTLTGPLYSWMENSCRVQVMVHSIKQHIDQQMISKYKVGRK
jgi:hypothetical protein